MKTFVLFLVVAAPNFSQTQTTVDFTKQIQPLLAAKCFSCHGGEVAQGGLRLDRRQAAMRGGDYGPVILPGNSAKSKLILRVVSGDGGLKMPPTEPLLEEEIELLRAWIDQGADYRIEVPEPRAPKALSLALASFIDAIRNREDKKVESMLAADPGLVKGRDLVNSTPLHHATAFGTLATIKVLIEKGAEVNATNRRKTTPLVWALHDEAKVRLLLNHGADVNARLVDGSPVVRQVALLGNGNRVLRLLLDKGADPNVGTATGLTALMAAANRGNTEAMQMLIDKGAKVDARNAGGSSALLNAAGSGNPKAVQLLLEAGADPNTKTKRGDTALNAAATEGTLKSVRLLIAKGAKVNSQDERGHTPLIHAAASEAVPADVVKLLLDNGADAKLTGEYDETAATHAARRGITDVAKLLGAIQEERASVKPVGDAPRRTAAQAVAKALPMLEKQSYNFIRIGGCNSCHSQDLASAANGFAKARGIPAPKEIPQLSGNLTGITPERILDTAVVGVSGMVWEMFDLGINQAPATVYTDAVINYIRNMQVEDGHWKTSHGRRPPMNDGDLQTAALSVYALKTYTPAASRTETELAVSKARNWLESQKPINAQDRAFHLMGLVWAGASKASIHAAMLALRELQKPDGGWSQFPTMETDSYATGEALYAFHIAGVPPSQLNFSKGVSYLLRTQAADGTWHVRTRAIWLQPYFESGFPYGKDQFISTAGTAWAALALASATEPPAPAVAQN